MTKKNEYIKRTDVKAAAGSLAVMAVSPWLSIICGKTMEFVEAGKDISPWVEAGGIMCGVLMIVFFMLSILGLFIGVYSITVGWD